MSIVIVDDSVTNLIVLKHLASGDGSRPVLSFTASIAAVEHLKTNSAELIIVDCEMPHMNGIEFIAAVRRIPQHANTPIVMVTQHAAQDIRRRALEAGATDFLNKPVNAGEFKLRVRNLLRLKPELV